MDCKDCNKEIDYFILNSERCASCTLKYKIEQSKKIKEVNKRSHKRKCLTCSKKFSSIYKVEKYCSISCRKNFRHTVANNLWGNENRSRKKTQTSLQRKKIKDSFNKYTVHLPKETIGDV